MSLVKNEEKKENLKKNPMSGFSLLKETLPIEWDEDQPVDYEDDDIPGFSTVALTPEEKRRETKRREHQTIILSLSKIYYCLICNLPFKQQENLLGYRCSMHIGEYRYDYARGEKTWNCCGRRVDHRGCTPCLHAATEWIRDEMYTDKSNATFEIASDIIDYGLVEFNPNMFTNFRRGGDYSRNNMFNVQVAQQVRPSVTGSSGDLIVQPVKKFYFIPRIK